MIAAASPTRDGGALTTSAGGLPDAALRGRWCARAPGERPAALDCALGEVPFHGARAMARQLFAVVYQDLGTTLAPLAGLLEAFGRGGVPSGPGQQIPDLGNLKPSPPSPLRRAGPDYHS